MGRYRGVFGFYGVASLPFSREAPKKRGVVLERNVTVGEGGEKNQASRASAVVKEQLFPALNIIYITLCHILLIYR